MPKYDVDWSEINLPAGKVPDPNARADQKTCEEERDIDLQAALQQLTDAETNRLERIKYAERIFWLMSSWLIGMGVILLLSGFGKDYGFFSLNKAVLITLVSGTSLNIIGIFAIVVNYLFKNGKSIKEKISKGA
jgi:hypothetical protein